MFGSVCFAGPACKNTFISFVMKSAAANAVAGTAFGYVAELVQPASSKWPSYLAAAVFTLVMVTGGVMNFAQSSSWVVLLANLVTPLAGIISAAIADKRQLIGS